MDLCVKRVLKPDAPFVPIEPSAVRMMQVKEPMNWFTLQVRERGNCWARLTLYTNNPWKISVRVPGNAWCSFELESSC